MTSAEFMDAGSVEDFAPGSVRFLGSDREIGVFNIDGEFHAIKNRCPHRGGPICEGELRGTMIPSAPGEFVPGLQGQVLHCPWHQWEFDVTTGEALFGIDEKRHLIRYPVVVEDGHVFVRSDTTARRERSE